MTQSGSPFLFPFVGLSKQPNQERVWQARWPGTVYKGDLIIAPHFMREQNWQGLRSNYVGVLEYYGKQFVNKSAPPTDLDDHCRNVQVL